MKKIIGAKPVGYGRWVTRRIEKYDSYGNYTNAPGPTFCSNCNFSAYGIADVYNFCPICGYKNKNEPEYIEEDFND